MDFINKSLAPLAELFRSMTPAARLTMALLSVVLVVSLAFLFQRQTQEADEYLFSGEPFSRGELAAMEAAFGKAGLNQYEIAGNRIRVPGGKRYLYVKALADNGAMPDNASSATDAALATGNPFESARMQEIKLRAAKEKDLSFTIQRMQGLETATVKLEDVTTPGFPPRKERRALVAVSGLGSKFLNEEQVRAIREMVASGAGVSPEHVTVTDLNAGRAYPGTSENGLPTANDNLYAATKRMFERAWRDKIAEQLAMIPGVMVGVNVELDPDLNNQVSSLKFDEKPTSVESVTVTKEQASTGPDPGGRPGAVPNGVVGNTARTVSSAGRGESTANESREEQRSIAGRTQTSIQKAPLTPTRVTASINVPKSYYETVWKQENLDPAAAESKPDGGQLAAIEQRVNNSIRNAVVNLLPKTGGGEDPAERVQVVSYVDLPPTLPESPQLTAQALTWLGAYWPTLALIALAGMGLLVLRSALGPKPQGPAPAVPLLARSAAEGGEAERAAGVTEGAEEKEKRRLRFQSGGRSLREELAEMVKEDPEAAANVLRNWIGDAA